MDNRILRVEVRDGSIVPAAAEVWVRADVERVTPTTELRGRLMGPHCRFASTIEVAYPLRPFVRTPEGFAGPSGRVIIPEASLWDPQCPFLYQGPVELWQDGNLCQRLTIRHGLRKLALGPRGLVVNGQPLALRGREMAALTETEALALRENGVNLLVVAVTEETETIWELADRIGFLVLGRITDFDAAAARLTALSAHASCLGWLAERADVGKLSSVGFVGTSLTDRPDAPLPKGVQFVVGDAGLANLGLPLLVRGMTAPDAPGVLGTFE